MKLGIVQEDVFVGNESDINIEFSLNICWNLGIILEICAYHVSPACKIHRRPIILSIEMDAYPLQEIVDDRMSETRPFLDRRSARSIRACNIVHLCHGSKMERDKYPVIPYSHSLLLLFRMIDISRKYIATKKIIATNKKKIRSRHHRAPCSRNKISLSKPQTNRAREICKFFNSRFNGSG